MEAKRLSEKRIADIESDVLRVEKTSTGTDSLFVVCHHAIELLSHIAAQEAEIKGLRGNDRKIVCLCGSTRFWREFQRASLRETLDGNIVLSIGAATGTDDEHFGNLPKAEYDQIKENLDLLHLDKVAMCDEVLILNVGGYIGESTRRELNHAIKLGKQVRYLEPPDGVTR